MFDGDWDARGYWSTTNLGEAIPGVLTPMTWALWGGVGERAARQSFRHVGGLSRAEGEVPADPKERMFGIFLGRFACKVDTLRPATADEHDARRTSAIGQADAVAGRPRRDELLGLAGRRDGLAALALARRAERTRLATLRLPSSWRGRPTPLEADEPEPITDRAGLLVSGLGASSGVVDGPVRVVLDPDFEEVEPGEILVAPVTDPSWASIMFCAAALVVDLGGMLSHAAVVAREMGIPCVMGTQDGTRRLRTGDLCRVDGHAGTVTVLVAAPAAELAPDQG